MSLALKNKPIDRDLWETPDSLFEFLHNRFNFTIDAAANEENKKLERYTSDALSDPTYYQEYQQVSHDEYEIIGVDRVFCNPPYSKCREFVTFFQKLWDGYRVPSLLLIPVRSDRLWWNDARKYPDCRFEFYTGRLKFSESKTSAFMYSMNLIFGFEEVEAVDPIDASLFGGGRAKT